MLCVVKLPEETETKVEDIGAHRKPARFKIPLEKVPETGETLPVVSVTVAAPL